jgi:hypothetical protein
MKVRDAQLAKEAMKVVTAKGLRKKVGKLITKGNGA